MARVCTYEYARASTRKEVLQLLVLVLFRLSFVSSLAPSRQSAWTILCFSFPLADFRSRQPFFPTALMRRGGGIDKLGDLSNSSCPCLTYLGNLFTDGGM
ncbi:hypothetical protein J3F83DRAFT_740421 [Trichoderma novae-zelandiae]